MTSQPIAERHRNLMASTVMTMIVKDFDLPVEVALRYDSRDPFALQMIFSVPGKQAVEWVFSRELVLEGLQGLAGQGDVQIFPGRRGIVLELTSPAGRATFVADPAALDTFLQQVFAAVPLGAESEYYDFDHELALLDDFGSTQV